MSVWLVVGMLALTSGSFMVLPYKLQEFNYNFRQLILKQFSFVTALSLLIFSLVNTEMEVLVEGCSSAIGRGSVRYCGWVSFQQPELHPNSVTCNKIEAFWKCWNYLYHCRGLS